MFSSFRDNNYAVKIENLRDMLAKILLLFTASAAVAKTLSTWDFGGTWSSELAGVRFDMDAHSTIGVDKNMPVRISEMFEGTKSNGFLNKGWMAKANAQYGQAGPVSLFAVNRPEKTVAVFVGNKIH